METLDPPSGTPVEVDIHWMRGECAGEIAYTVRGVVTSLQFDPQRIGIAIRSFRYPDGRTKKASGLSYYDRGRVRQVLDDHEESE